MPVQSTDTTAITVAGNLEMWVIKSGVVVAGSFSALTDNYSAVQVINYGTLLGAGYGLTANGDSGGANAVITNAVGGIMSGFNAGISIAQKGAALYNRGEASGHNDGIIVLGASCYIENSGSISGQAGIYQASDDGVIINSGSISGQLHGVELDTTSLSSTRIVNTGTIRGGFDSIYASSTSSSAASIENKGELIGAVDLTHSTSACSISNQGTIAGDVLFGFGADSYDGRLGVVSGKVSGGAGADTLLGGVGDDAFAGGAGRDRLDGGKGGGEDSFVYTSTMDSPRNAPDVISRHWTAADTIDLSGIDPDTHHAGDQAFAYGGLINPGDQVATRSVQYFHQGGDTYVVADTNGDGQADFEIIIRGNFTLNAGEFVL